MDFSSPARALESLGRRRPALPDEILEAAKVLSNNNDCSPSDYLNAVQVLTQSERWEGLTVGILLATQILVDDSSLQPQVFLEGPRVPEERKEELAATATATSGLELSREQLATVATWLYQASLEHLEHDEPRVRTFVAKAVGAHATWTLQETDNALAQTQRLSIFTNLLASIDQHITKGRDETPDVYSKSSEGALDDTTGWRALETNWQCLACWIASLGGSFWSLDGVQDLIFAQMPHLEYSCNTHVNRHVRAAGIAVLEQMVHTSAATGTEAGAASSLLIDPTSPLRKTIIQVLKVGLADNWSQVRMAASVLNRIFWMALTELKVDASNFQLLYPVLVPRMCLNRFYLAQGVKLYSHQTWKCVFPEQGVDVVALTVGPLVRYYVQMCDADNHVVREAACQAVAELAVKLGMSSMDAHRQALQPHVPLLLQALLMCFHDESWPVRDEACLACGTFCRAYPEECRADLETLWTRWTEQLTDQIWSVRADAAVALAEAMRAYGLPFQERLFGLIGELLPGAKNQPNMTPAEFKALQNNEQAHTENQLYSCGSLAPKLKKKAGAGRIGCGNCDVTREKQPWEATDGCLYMIREMMDACVQSSNNSDKGLQPLGDDVLLPLLTQVADVCRVSHFPQGDDLRATLWRQLPAMCTSVGKLRTKRLYLELFLDLLLRNLESTTASAISKHAASTCAFELSQLVGPSIFMGRLQDDRQRHCVENVFRERQQQEQSMMGHSMAQNNPDQQTPKQFSPFEPPGLLDNLDKMMPMPYSSMPSMAKPVVVAPTRHPGVDDSFPM
jgi:hypothetical protein